MDKRTAARKSAERGAFCALGVMGVKGKPVSRNTQTCIVLTILWPETSKVRKVLGMMCTQRDSSTSKTRVCYSCFMAWRVSESTDKGIDRWKTLRADASRGWGRVWCGLRLIRWRYGPVCMHIVTVVLSPTCGTLGMHRYTYVFVAGHKATQERDDPSARQWKIASWDAATDTELAKRIGKDSSGCRAPN